MAAYHNASVKETPLALIKLKFCEKFGWTIHEFYEQPWKDICEFAIIMSEENKQEKLQSERAKSSIRAKSGHTRGRTR